MARPGKIVVHHPTPGQTLAVCSCTAGGAACYFILAQGLAQGVVKLTANLTDLTTSTQYPVVVHRSGIHWQFGFTPLKPATGPSQYLLLVSQLKANAGTPG